MTTKLNNFAKATRIKLRFTIPQGRGFLQGSVEDLWDLPVRKLKPMAEGLYQQLRGAQETLYGAPEVDTDKVLALDILKEIISIKDTEAKAIANARKKSEERGKLLELLAKKEDEEKNSLSKEELLAKLAELDS